MEAKQSASLEFELTCISSPKPSNPDPISDPKKQRSTPYSRLNRAEIYVPYSRTRQIKIHINKNNVVATYRKIPISPTTY